MYIMIESYFITNMFQSFPPSGEREGGFYHGFTGHEYLPWFKLYNMNGRLYDPVVGRFLEPDPVIQNATSTQNLNRYCYALNNPFKYVDPSGNRLMPGPGEERWINEDAERIGGSFGLQGGYWQSRNNFNTGHWEFIYGYRLQTAYAGVEYSEKYNDTRLIFEGARAVWVKDNSEIMRINPQGQGGGRDWFSKTQIGMESFGLANRSKIELFDLAAVTDPSVNSLKYVKGVKIAGKVLSGAGVVITTYQVYDDAFNKGNYYSAGTRAVVFGFGLASTAIPFAGWAVAGGIGLADAIWGDQFYNWVELNLRK